jgi:PAS domain S-box-containing protein
MMNEHASLTGHRIDFPHDLLIVSKTDVRGGITYANDGFCDIAGYRRDELLGRPHSLLRHPEMPRSAFALMWSTIAARQEFFAYVMNRAKNGDHYWVFAHVVPDIDPDTDQIVGYHSARRWADPVACEQAMEVYQALLDVEARERGPKAAVEAGTRALLDVLSGAGISYEQWVFSLGR